MELRDLIKVFVSRKNLFWSVFLGCVAISLLVFQFQPKRYEAALSVNVTRSGMQKTADYTYDHFYRLQADERFADTVVRWLASPSVRSMVSEQAGNSRKIIETIEAKRLSSQLIDIRYRADDPRKLSGIDGAIVWVLNEETRKLNEQSDDPNWFSVIGDKPVVSDVRIEFWRLFLGGLLGGLFLGFFSVLWSWYLKSE